MFHGNVNPGKPSCDKAQFNCCCQIWSSFSTRFTHFISLNVIFKDALCLPTCMHPLKHCWTLQYCVMAWLFLTLLAVERVNVMPKWIEASGTCKLLNHDIVEKVISCPLTVPLQCFEPEPVQSKWCIFLSETILDKSLFGKIKPV